MHLKQELNSKMKEFKSREKEGELHEQNACGDVDERGIPIKVKRIQLFS